MINSRKISGCAWLPVELPHCIRNADIYIVFDDKGLAGFKLNWVFDRMFSAAIILDFDRDGDGTFNKEEIGAIKKEAFANLRNFNYFCYITINSSVFQVQYVTDFSAGMRQNRLIYDFFVPCHVRGTPGYKTVTTAVYDETYFTDITYDPAKPVLIENGDFFEHSYELVENKKRAYWGEQIIPTEICLRFRKKQ